MKLKIGIVGYGAIGKAHYAELRRSDKFEVCGVFDKNCKDEFCRAPQFENFKDFIAQSHPQALVLCVEQKELFDAFNECAKFCQNILIACGGFKNLDRLKELNYVAKSAKIRVCAGFSDRFRPAIVSLQKALSKESEIYSGAARRQLAAQSTPRSVYRTIYPKQPGRSQRVGARRSGAPRSRRVYERASDPIAARQNRRILTLRRLSGCLNGKSQGSLKHSFPSFQAA